MYIVINWGDPPLCNIVIYQEDPLSPHPVLLNIRTAPKELQQQLHEANDYMSGNQWEVIQYNSMRILYLSS